MASGDVAFQLVSITHGGTEYTLAIGGSFNDVIQVLPVVYNTEVYAQQLPIQGRSMEGEATNLYLDDEVAAGTKGTLLYTLRQADGSNATVQATNMAKLSTYRDFNTAPYSKRIEHSNNGTPVLSIAI